MVRIRKKQTVAEDVYTLALERLRLCFDRFDRVVVSFSGGKDSTACLQLALLVARAKGRLPLDVFTYDEEAIPPETVDYLDRVAGWPDLAFRWYCLPIECRNACSRRQPSWYPWAEEDRPRWCRDLPALAITEPPAGFQRQSSADTTVLLYGPDCGSVCQVMGIRTQESMTRYGAIAREKQTEPFLSQTPAPHLTKAYPIYDWSTEDVWLAPHQFGWDYNRAYDRMEAAGLHRLEARCSPPYGEQPIRRLWAYKVCWPELWVKMVDRVPGAATAARYANTDLYGIGLDTDADQQQQSWQQRCYDALRQLDPESARAVALVLKMALDHHRRRTAEPLPDAAQHPVSGFSWKLLHGCAAAGGNKLGRQWMKIQVRATAARRRNGLDVPMAPR